MSEITPINTINLVLKNRELARDPHIMSQHTWRKNAADLAAFEFWRSGQPLSKYMVDKYTRELLAAGDHPTPSITFWRRCVGGCNAR
jgi:hypothetical protein